MRLISADLVGSFAAECLIASICSDHTFDRAFKELSNVTCYEQMHKLATELWAVQVKRLRLEQIVA